MRAAHVHRIMVRAAARRTAPVFAGSVAAAPTCMNGERGGRVLRTAELTLCCLSVARADGAVESGVAPARREVGKSLMAAFALVALGLVAATTIIVNYQSAVTLEEVIVRGADVLAQVNRPVGPARAHPTRGLSQAARQGVIRRGAAVYDIPRRGFSEIT